MPDENKFYADTNVLTQKIHTGKETFPCQICGESVLISRLDPGSSYGERPAIYYSGYCVPCDVTIETSVRIGNW